MIEKIATRRLMTHLAQFSVFSKQGEVLCTRGLEYLLETSEAKAAFSNFLTSLFSVSVSPDLHWRAEVKQKDGTRPDLEAYTADGKPLIKIEAKLRAQFGAGQLRSYAADLQGRAGGGLLLVLVPRDRIAEANTEVLKTFELDKANCVVAVASWDDVLDQLGSVTSDPFDGDLAQFRAMYRALSGDVVEPFVSNDAIREWRSREGAFIHYIERATRALTQPNTPLPMALEKNDQHATPTMSLADQTIPAQGYLRRYVCRALNSGATPCLSVGVRDPFERYLTPIWLRFHRKTPMFRLIRERLLASELYRRTLVEENGHLWIPFDVPLNTEVKEVVCLLVAHAESIFAVALGATPTP